MGAVPELVTVYDCQNCKVRPRRFRGTTLAGFSLETCHMCLYIFSGGTFERLPDAPKEDGPTHSGVQCDGVGQFLYGAGPTYQEGHMTYATQVTCDTCDRVFRKLAARKDGHAYIPMHYLP
jgi:hypothetical protein